MTKDEDGKVEWYMDFDTWREANNAVEGLRNNDVDAWIEDLNESVIMRRKTKAGFEYLEDETGATTFDKGKAKFRKRSL